MKKIICLLITLVLLIISGIIYLNERKVTVYKENEEKIIKAKDTSSYVEDGWYKEPVFRIYNEAGESMLITETSFGFYDNGEWDRVPFLPVYSDRADKMMVKQSDYEFYIENGWYAEPPDHEALEELRAEIEHFLKGRGGSWGVFIQDLSDNGYLLINEGRYSAASVIKLFTMAATYNEIEKGNLEKSEDIKYRLNSMITISSNEACNYLTIKNGGGSEVSGFDRENEIAEALGCENTGRGSYIVELSGRKGAYRFSNYTSPRDCGRVLKAIYNGTLVSKSASEEMLNLLLDQTRIWKIPSGVPENVKVANKTGENDTVNSDVGIVFSPGGDYIICVLGNGNVTYGAYTIQKISEMAYNYFNK